MKHKKGTSTVNLNLDIIHTCASGYFWSRQNGEKLFSLKYPFGRIPDSIQKIGVH